MLAALLTTAVLALGQDAPLPLSADRPVIPSAGLATENGPGALWVNPANMAYDPDPRWALLYRHDPDGSHPHGVAGTYGVGGFGAGLRWMYDALGRSDFVLDLALGVRLPERVAVGAAVRVHILDQRDDFAALDLSAAWRPVPWFGLTAITRNLGNPGGPDSAATQIGGGIAVRPIGPTLIAGVDYLHAFDDFGDLGFTGVRPQDQFAFTTRVRPISGLFLRASLDTTLRFGAGVELYFGGVGLGAHAGSQDYQGVPDLTVWVGSDERDEHLAPPSRQVSALRLEDAPAYQPPRRLLRRSDPSWLETLEHFRRVEAERGVRGMLLTLGDVDLSWARWQELRDAIRRVRGAGGVVVVHLVGSPGNGAVYAASAADEIVVHPASSVHLVGLSAETVYVRGLLDTVGIGVDVVRRGDHKAVAEALTRREPSVEDRAQVEALLDDVYDELVTGLADGRARTREDVEAWIDDGPFPAEAAVQRGLVDDRAYPDQLADRLAARFDGKVRLVDLGERRRPRSPWEDPEQIAVVYLEGTLTRGPSTDGGLLSGPTAGAQTIVDLLEEAARDVKIRAVVLRVDSPGGSAFAADEVWRAVQRVRAAGKPVVASLGGSATSGGYYAAVGADAIWAEPTTITGSIGVIAIKPDLSGLAERIGLTSTRITRGRHAAIDSIWQPWDPVARTKLLALADATYRTFTDRVAEGRGLTPEEVEAIAQGRIWSGRAAHAVGLVDELGGLEPALLDARRLAGIPDRRAVAYVGLRTQRGLPEILLGDVVGLATQARLNRIDARIAQLSARGLGADGVLAPLSLALGLFAIDDTQLWMIEPDLIEVGPR